MTAPADAPGPSRREQCLRGPAAVADERSRRGHRDPRSTTLWRPRSPGVSRSTTHPWQHPAADHRSL